MSKKNAKTSRRLYPLALTVAGSDSGGGAGIEADLRTFSAFGVYGCCVITAVTSQNPRRVTRIDKMSPESVRAQIDAVMACFEPLYMKTGMLGGADIMAVVAEAAARYRIRLICDPVMVATSGSSLAGEDSARAMRELLLPAADWITPNIPEAESLLADGTRISCENDLFRAAEELHRRFGVSVLLKGGHAGFSEAVDAVCREGKLYRLTSPRADVPPLTSHGTGCTLSAALTAGFTLGAPWKQVLCQAKAFVLGSLAQSVELAPGLFAMYPPTDECFDQVRLEEIGGGTGK